jgi:hypothetical protein
MAEIPDICGPCDSEHSSYLLDPNSQYIIDGIGLGDIKVSWEPLLGGGKRFIVQKIDYLPPIINAQPNPNREVGDTINFTFDVSITKGREDIVSRTITPELNVDLALPFNIQLEDFTSEQIGFKQAYSLSVTDTMPNVITRNFGVNFLQHIMHGFHYDAAITEADTQVFTKILANGVMNVYGGEITYTFPTSIVNHYLYWLNRVGATPIAKATLSGYNLPLVHLPGTMTIENQYGIMTEYTVTRTANPFGGGTLKITLF